MQSSNIPRHRHSPEQRTQLVDEYLGSGLTQNAFAARVGISVATLQLWLRKLNPLPAAKASRSVRLLELPSVAMPRRTESVGYQVFLANGTRVQIPLGFEIGEARQLLILAASL